jgi:hypothetical protein
MQRGTCDRDAMVYSPTSKRAEDSTLALSSPLHERGSQSGFGLLFNKLQERWVACPGHLGYLMAQSLTSAFSVPAQVEPVVGFESTGDSQLPVSCRVARNSLGTGSISKLWCITPLLSHLGPRTRWMSSCTQADGFLPCVTPTSSSVQWVHLPLLMSCRTRSVH